MTASWHGSHTQSATRTDWVVRLATAIREGKVIDLAPDMGDELLRLNAGQGLPSIPAAAIREVLLLEELRPDPQGLTIRAANLEGHLDLSNVAIPCPVAFIWCQASSVSFAYATISNLKLTGSSFTTGSDISLDLDGIDVRASVWARELHAVGKISARGAQIQGTFDLTSAVLTVTDGDTLDLDGASIKGGLVFKKMRSCGRIRARGAQLGELDASEAILTSDTDVLSLDQAVIEHGFIANSLEATGRLRCVGSQFHQLNLANASLSCSTGDALSLDGAIVTSGVMAANLKATGRIRAVGARVGGDLSLRDVALGELLLQRATLQTLFLTGTQTELNVKASRIDILLAEPSGTLSAAGWSLGDVHDVRESERGCLRSHPELLLEWLATDPEQVPQAWHEAADTYQRIGLPAVARKFHHTAAIRTGQSIAWKKHPFQRLGQSLYRSIVGYGYHPEYTFYWILATYLVTAFVCRNATDLFVPTNPSWASGYNGGSTSLPAGLPAFSSWLYAAAAITPAGAFTPSNWQPTTLTLIGIISVTKAIGWILTVLFGAGLAGMLRKTA